MPSGRLTYLGHSATCIELPSGNQILIDPFLSGNPVSTAAEEVFDTLIAICLTHGHPDHVGDTIRLAKTYGCKVYATYELATLLAKDGVPEANVVQMNKGGSVDAGEFRITLEQAFHSSSYTAADGATYYAGEAASIVLQIDGGPCIFHAGDTLLFSDLSLIQKRYQPDIALLPIGDCFTMGPADAARAAKLIQPKRVIPIHFATFDKLTGTPEAFCSELEDSDIEVAVLKSGDTISI